MIPYKTTMEKKINELKKRFEELDKDKDGSVTMKEFKEELIDQGFPECLATKFMSKFDHDKDGRITLDEFIKTLLCTDDSAFSPKAE
ncbi:unnamed protein product [Schistosoma rodhaini]|uniref:EF-hand domain-containing protein n=1 Tax=Schistosoma rodhaini TaxID=6188 RepID=A0AA85EJW7_9TREM|nr:unnamed protein product [Schistosoma rodhaini]